MIVPVYQSEISEADNRGKLACIEFTGNIVGYSSSVVSTARNRHLTRGYRLTALLAVDRLLLLVHRVECFVEGSARHASRHRPNPRRRCTDYPRVAEVCLGKPNTILYCLLKIFNTSDGCSIRIKTPKACVSSQICMVAEIPPTSTLGESSERSRRRFLWTLVI